MENENIFSYIKNQESFYQTRPITITEGYDWQMFQHIRLSTLYKNTRVESGNADGMKPIKNIIKPILNVAYRSEGFDVKDITIFVDSEKDYYKSFLTKKFHNKWARKNDLDTFIDDLVESYIDYGGGLCKNTNEAKPEVVPLQRIAFCDQTDLLSGIIAEKHPYTPDQLLEMTKWDQAKIEEAIDAAIAEKTATTTLDAKKNPTPQKYIEVYELHGVMPTKWLSKEEGDEYDVEGHDYTRQAQYVTFATKEKKEKGEGIVLWKGKESKIRYKLVKRDAVYGRALGYGGIEELFEPQVWTTYSMIKIREMLDAAALMLLKTSDASFAEKNKTTELETGEILVVAEGKDVSQLNLQPINMQNFENSLKEWDAHARTMGSASESALAVRPTAGTPFSLEALNVQNGLEMHQYRQGKIATFVGEVYRDWILPYISRELAKGSVWIDELSLDEMQWVAERIADSEIRTRAIEAFRNKGAIPTKEEGEQLKLLMKEKFKKSGSKQFLEIFQNEMKTLPLDVEVNIVGKQKDLAKLTVGLTNIFRQVFANPAILKDPAMAKIFNEILEASGLSPADFSGLMTSAMPADPNAVPADTTIPADKTAVAVA